MEEILKEILKTLNSIDENLKKITEGGEPGSLIKKCALPECNILHTRRGKYCCTRHTNLAAKRAQYERERQNNQS